MKSVPENESPLVHADTGRPRASRDTVYVIFWKAEHQRQVGSIHRSLASAEALVKPDEYIEAWDTWDFERPVARAISQSDKGRAMARALRRAQKLLRITEGQRQALVQRIDGTTEAGE